MPDTLARCAGPLRLRLMRRPDGALEDDVLRAMWDSGEALLPAEILEKTGLDLAYTSIATVLTRLLEKGLVEREPEGRAFRYRAAFDEGELAAKRIGVILSHTSDRNAALAGFVSTLGKRDAATLRSLLAKT